MNQLISSKAAAVLTIVNAGLSLAAIPALLAAFPQGTTVPIWALVAVAAVNGVGAVIRLVTTNSLEVKP